MGMQCKNVCVYVCVCVIVPGHMPRGAAISAIKRVCDNLGTPYPDFKSALPKSLWHESGKSLQCVTHQAKTLSDSLYIKIVDTGLGHLVSGGHGAS